MATESQPSSADKDDPSRTLVPHVYEETDPLKILLVWGPPSVETLLGQILPAEISLFYKTFDVSKARVEFGHFLQLLNSEKVAVIQGRNLLADSLPINIPGMPSSIRDLGSMVRARAMELSAEYKNRPLWMEQVDDILENDVELLGGDERKAIALNYTVALGEMPLANILYARDQSGAFGQKMVFSKMRHAIRRPEVALYRMALGSVLNGQEFYQVDGDGSFENGDGMMFNQAAWTGAGIRSNQQAAEDIFRATEEDLTLKGFDFYVVADEYQESINNQVTAGGPEMNELHVDTFSMPTEPGRIITCEEVAARRLVRQISRNQRGEIRVESIGGLLDIYAKRGIEVDFIPKDEQLNFGTNFLHLGNRRAIVPLSENVETLKALERAKVRVIPAEIRELVGGFGATHCMSGAIERRTG